MVVRELLRVAAGVILPHMRAEGRGKHLPPRAHQERDEKNAHGQLTTPHKSKLQMYSETVLAAQYSTRCTNPATSEPNLDNNLT
jgi:hypothetical protein